VAIVSNLQELQTTFFDKNFEVGRSSIDGILDEFLQGMDGSNNDLSCGDLVDDIWIECLKTLGGCVARGMLRLTLILLGAVTTERSSAFLFVPLGVSESSSMGSAMT
jgi:hypothetical protein